MSTRDQWLATQAQGCVKRVMKRVAGAWGLLGPEVIEALVCREIIYLMMGQDESVQDTPISKWIDLSRRAIAHLGVDK